MTDFGSSGHLACRSTRIRSFLHSLLQVLPIVNTQTSPAVPSSRGLAVPGSFRFRGMRSIVAVLGFLALGCGAASQAQAAPADAGPVDHSRDSEMDDPVDRTLADRVLERLAEQNRNERLHPLAKLAGQMGKVAANLGRQKTGRIVQEKQDAIIREFDRLIAQLEEQGGSGGGQGGGGAGSPTARPSAPLADSAIVGGPGGIGALRGAARGGYQLNALEPGQRERILQALDEGFPPGYEDILADYYKRLARQRIEGGE